jgi:LysR family hydrogen peroxide-inducible transcriptional activator
MPALPTLRQLGYLVELAERLNFREAAEAQHVTQSTLSAGIKELESVLGVQLVERNKRHVRLTAAGEEVVARARALLAAAQDLADIARRAGEPLGGPLRLGVIPTIAPFLLPGLLPPLRKAYPSLKLYLREDLTERLLEQVQAGRLDFALIALPYDTGDMLVRELFVDEFWFVAREDDPLARAETVAVKAINPDAVLLLEEGHCLRNHAIEACGARGARSGSRMEATSLHTLIQMVEGRLGVTLLPEMTLKAGLLKGTRLVARPFAAQVPSRTVALAARRTTPQRRDFELLADFIAAQARASARAGIPAHRRSQAKPR